MKNLLVILIPVFFSCSATTQSNTKISENEKLQMENDSLKAIIANSTADTKTQITTFLTFQENNAEEAMNFYMSLFENSEILEIQRHGADGPGKEGSVFYARFSLNGKEIHCSDSPVKHEWDFTPGVSLFVECKTLGELENLFEQLSEDGIVYMPLNNYGFSQKFGFVEDRFGVSWQLNLQ